MVVTTMVPTTVRPWWSRRVLMVMVRLLPPRNFAPRHDQPAAPLSGRPLIEGYSLNGHLMTTNLFIGYAPKSTPGSNYVTSSVRNRYS